MSDFGNNPAANSMFDSNSPNKWKRRAQEQWTHDPCGAHVARDLEFGSRAYFDAIETYRYEVASPWMKNVIGFDRYAGKRVLEVGCGTGTDLLQFARGGAIVTGVDLTARSIEIARRRFAVYGLDAELSIGDGERLAFPDESFDMVYSFGVLHHTPDTSRAIQEVRRVLRAGGRAVVMLYNRSSIYYWGGVILRHGLISGELFSQSTAEIMSRHVEYSESDARPLVKAYTKLEALRLFGDFSERRVEVQQLTRQELGFLSPLIADCLLRWLSSHFGWNLIIEATR